MTPPDFSVRSEVTVTFDVRLGKEIEQALSCYIQTFQHNASGASLEKFKRLSLFVETLSKEIR